MDQNPYTTHDSKVVYENQWLKVREDSVTYPDGTQGVYNAVDAHDAVAILALNEQEEICFVHGYDYITNAWRWGLAGGNGANQDPVQVAMRELVEATGFVAHGYHFLGSLHLRGLLNEKTHIIVMKDLVQTGENHQAQKGIDLAQFLAVEAAEQKIATGEIDNPLTIAALYLYKSWRTEQDRQAAEAAAKAQK